MRGGVRLASLITTVAIATLAACSGSPNKGFDGPGGGSGNGPGTGGNGNAPSIGGDDGGSAAPTAACVPDPANYDIPGNGCDDDGDGQVDNTAVCDKGLAVDGDANAFAKAIGLCQTADGKKWGVVSAAYANGHDSTDPPNGMQHGILGKFGSALKPREGSSLGVLSSGYGREYDDQSGSSSAFKGQKQPMQGSGGPFGLGGNSGSLPQGYPKSSSGCPTLLQIADDIVTVKLQIKVPANAKGLQFDFDFYSGEWPEFVCSPFNDSFIAYLSAQGFNNGAPENISFDAKNQPVSVDNGFFDRCTPSTTTGCCAMCSAGTSTCPGGIGELAGTGFEDPGNYCGSDSAGGGATGWLTTTAPVNPGETITIEFMIWDTGDWNFDSSVLVDHFTWVPTAVQVAGTQRPPS
jgi:hypothetical protein